MIWTHLAVAVIALSALQCGEARHAPESGPLPLMTGDTIRGSVVMLGPEPGASASLMTLDRRVVSLLGQPEVLRQVVGLEVVVWGNDQTDREFEVDGVLVRAHAGVPAVDGVLTRAGGVWGLTTVDGVVPLTRWPAGLAEREGARVWIAGPLDRSPDAWGTIE